MEIERIEKSLELIVKNGFYRSIINDKNLNELAKNGDFGLLYKKIYNEFKTVDMDLCFDGLDIFDYFVTKYNKK